MKKKVLWISLLVMCLFFIGCSNADPVIDSLPAYDSMVFYTCEGIQDHTDYAKYTFQSITEEQLQASNYFCTAKEENITEILQYVDNFESWVEVVGGELKNYDFNKAIISEGDFFYIDTKDGEPIGQGTYGKFDHYSVYYFHLATQTLYYFHNNI